MEEVTYLLPLRSQVKSFNGAISRTNILSSISSLSVGKLFSIKYRRLLKSHRQLDLLHGRNKECVKLLY